MGGIGHDTQGLVNCHPRIGTTPRHAVITLYVQHAGGIFGLAMVRPPSNGQILDYSVDSG